MKIITEPARAGNASCERAVPPNVACRAREGARETAGRSVRERREAFAEALASPDYGSGVTARAQSRAAGALGPRRVRTTIAVALVAILAGIAGTKLLWRDAPESPRATRVMLDFPAGQRPTFPFGTPYPVLAQMHDGRGLLYWGRGTAAPGAQLPAIMGSTVGRQAHRESGRRLLRGGLARW